MENKRVDKGETYWFINDDFDVHYCTELNAADDYIRFKVGNYFNTKEEAEGIAYKLRSVLNGADAIKWPSDEEIITRAIKIGEKFSTDIEVASQYACCAEMMVKWLAFYCY